MMKVAVGRAHSQNNDGWWGCTDYSARGFSVHAVDGDAPRSWRGVVRGGHRRLALWLVMWRGASLMVALARRCPHSCGCDKEREAEIPFLLCAMREGISARWQCVLMRRSWMHGVQRGSSSVLCAMSALTDCGEEIVAALVPCAERCVSSGRATVMLFDLETVQLQIFEHMMCSFHNYLINSCSSLILWSQMLCDAPASCCPMENSNPMHFAFINLGLDLY